MNQNFEHYQRAFEQAFDAIVIADDDGRYIDANRSACELFGVPKDELIGRTIEEFAPEGYDFASEWTDFHASGTDRDTFPLVRGDGDRRTVEYAATSNVAPGKHLSILRDITDRRERERKIKETQSKYRQLVEQNLVGIYIIRDRNFTYVNPRLAEIFGETPEEMIGRSPFQWIIESDHERVKENLRKREEGEVDSLNFTVQGKRSDGEPFDFEVYGGRVEIDGEPVILGTLQDVTERKEYERQIEHKNERLQDFAQILSHDLRNPLNVAQGRAELARENCDSEELTHVIRALERIETLIEDPLLLAQDGKWVDEREPVDLDDLLVECWQNVETNEAELDVETSLTVQGDESRLQQLGENLIRNAIEHGGTSVTITVGDLDERRGFFIEDDGSGLPADSRAKIFERGYSSSDGGFGMGLSIVKRISEAHGWQVSTHDGDAGGARFEFRLSQ